MLINITITEEVKNSEHVETAFETDTEYLNFVLNRAAESYSRQYNTGTRAEGITAARLAHNATIPPPSAPKPEV